MGTTRMITHPTSVLGMTLALFTLLMFMNPSPALNIPQDDSHPIPEFTDVRIVRLDLAIPHSGMVDLQRVTIHTDFNVNSPWCQWRNPLALPCPNPLLDQYQEIPRTPLVTEKSIPLL